MLRKSLYLRCGPLTHSLNLMKIILELLVIVGYPWFYPFILLYTIKIFKFNFKFLLAQFFRFHMEVASCGNLSLPFWLTSLSMIISSCIHVAVNGVISFFLWLSNIPLCICTTAFLSIHPKQQASFNFMAAVTICSDFGAQENKVCHHLRWSNGTGYHDLRFLNVAF